MTVDKMNSFLDKFQELNLPAAGEQATAYCGICEKDVDGSYIDTPEGKYFQCIHGHKTRKWVG